LKLEDFLQAQAINMSTEDLNTLIAEFLDEVAANAGRISAACDGMSTAAGTLALGLLSYLILKKDAELLMPNSNPAKIYQDMVGLVISLVDEGAVSMPNLVRSDA